MTSTRKHHVSAPRTPIQKAREVALVVFDVSQKDIATATGKSMGLISNAFRDRHRSLDVEEAIVGFLNDQYETLDPKDKRVLASVGIKDGVSRESMGWPSPYAVGSVTGG